MHGLVGRDAAARPRLTNKRVWASVARSMQAVIDDAFAEALRRDPDHARRWVVLVDGNLDHLERIKRAARSVGATITIVLDLIHVIEDLWRAAYAFHADGTIGAERWVENQLLKLLAGASGGAIAKSLRAYSYCICAIGSASQKKLASLTAAGARLDCPVVLLVVVPEPGDGRVVRWARQAIELEHRTG